jgi:hypothetical protein
MKSRSEKVDELLKQKQKLEVKFKKSIKSIKPEQKNEELKKFSAAVDDYTSKYELLKGTFMRDLDFIKMINVKLLEKYKNFNTYKLEVLYDFEEMKQETYDMYEKEIADLKQQKDKIILKNKKELNDENAIIEKLKREIKERYDEYPESSKEEQKQLYIEIIEKKKEIFKIKNKYIDIIPVQDNTHMLSTIFIDYNPIKDININSLELKLGENVELSDLGTLDVLE